VFYQLKRPLNHLVSPGGHLAAAAAAFRQSVARFTRPGTPIPIDITDSDLSKKNPGPKGLAFGLFHHLRFSKITTASFKTGNYVD
jgi:hypothetical protein